MKTENRLQEAFQYVCKTFFPRWKAQGWTAKLDLSIGAFGYCDSESKRIKVGGVPPQDDILHQILIEEICHAVTTGAHGEQWQTRMEKAAQKAQEIGREDLAQMLRGRIKSERNRPPLPKAADVYAKIREAVRENPAVAYEYRINWVANFFRFSKEGLEKQFKLCRQAYEKAVKDYSEICNNRN